MKYKQYAHWVFREVRDNWVFNYLLKFYGESGFLAEPWKMSEIWTGRENWAGVPGRGLNKRKRIVNENLLAIEDQPLWTYPPSFPSSFYRFNTN